MNPGDRRVHPLAVPYRVLVADDYEPWRQYVCAEIRQHPRWRVSGEAADGLEAVRLAGTLEPDLILLDVGLPHLNGIEAARRILEARPDARILFISQQHCPDIAEAALNAGGRGFLYRSDAARDLLFAMEAVVNRGRFVTASLSGPGLATPRHAQHHEAAFYSDDAALLDAYARFAEAAIGEGNTLICAASDVVSTALRQRLGGRGFDVERLMSESRLMWIDEARIISHILIDGVIDDGAFFDMVTPLIGWARSTSRGRVAACGGVSARLWTDGKPDAAIRLEHLWDGFVREHEIDILCGYSIDVPRLAGDHYTEFQSLCREHSLVHVR